MRAISVREAAQALGGDVAGSHAILCPGPGHSAHDRSLSVSFLGDGAFLVHSHAGDSWQACRDHVKAKLDLAEEPSRRREVPPVLTKEAMTEAALEVTMHALLQRTAPLKGTMAESYLRNRGLDPDLASPEALRFLPAKGRYEPAMVAVVTDFCDAARVLSLQYTPLKPDGTRGDRRFRRGAPIGGGVIRLVDDAEVTTELGLAEGAETGLAVMTAMKREGRMVRPVWSALNAGNMGKLPVVAGIDRLTIYVDADDAGRKGGGNLAANWHAAGRDVFIAAPPSGDWNEVAA